MIYFQPVLTEKEWETGDLSTFMVYRNLDNAKEDYPNKIIAAYKTGDIEQPTFVDDEDGRCITYYVDIPPTNGRSEWTNIYETFDKDEAYKFAKDNFGADENGMICIISKS